MFYDSMLYILKITDDCFMRCEYCSVADEFRDVYMELSTIENLLRKSVGFAEIQLTFLGGEPLMAGVDYYKDVFELAERYSKKYKYKIRYEMFTNGFLLNDEWMDLLEEKNVKIWMSYDGKGVGPKGTSKAQRVLQKYGKRIAGTNTVIGSWHNGYCEGEELVGLYKELESYGVRYMMHYQDVYDLDQMPKNTKMIIDLFDHIDHMKRPTTRFMFYDDMKRLNKWDTNKTHSAASGRVFINNDYVVHTDGTLKGGVPASTNPEFIYGNINELDHITDAIFCDNSIKHNRDYIKSMNLIGELEEMNYLTRGGGFIWNKADAGLPLDKPHMPFLRHFKEVIDHIRKRENPERPPVEPNPMQTKCY